MGSKPSPFVVLKHRDYLLAWIGLFISQIASQMIIVAINWQIYLMTKSALSLGIIGAARFLPMLLLSLFAGVAADMFDRKKVVIYAQLILVASAAMLTFLTFTGRSSPLSIYLLVALATAALTFGSPALSALTPHLVPRKHFLQAVSFNSLMWQLATIIGPAVGGIIIGFLGVGYVYLFCSIMYLILNFSMLAIKPMPIEGQKPEMNLRSIRQGVSFVRHTPLIWSTMLLDFFATFFASATTLMPIFAKDILKVGPQGLGFLYAAPSVGAVLAGLVFSSLHNPQKQGKIILVAVLMYGLSTILFGFSRILSLSLVCLFFIGATDAVSAIIRNTIRQMVTPDNLRGRMISVNMIFYNGGPQLGEVEAGIVATLIGTPLSVVLGGVGTVAVTIIMAYIVPTLRRYDSHRDL